MVFFLTNYLTVAFPCAQELTELDLSLLWSKRAVKNKLEKAPAPPGLAAAAADEMPIVSFSKWPVHSGPTVLDHSFHLPSLLPSHGNSESTVLGQALGICTGICTFGDSGDLAGQEEQDTSRGDTFSVLQCLRKMS